jgi:calcineurin-like phosphoesterase family protein
VHNLWFTADTHFGHNRIIQYYNRPFVDHLEMEEVMIDKFNSVIKKGDTLYHLGDVSWSLYDLNRFFGRLNTKQIHLILGNHDTNKTKHPNIRSYHDIRNQTIGDQYSVMCHYPMRSWYRKSKGSVMLFGHCHGALPPHDRSMDVGVDTNNFHPYSWDEIWTRMKDVPVFCDRGRSPIENL